MTKRPPPDEQTVSHDPSAPLRSPAAGDVLLVAGEGKMSAYPLAGAEIVIGRAPDCDIAIEHRALSRRHLVLRLGSPATVQDLGSTNGVRLGQRVVRGGARVPIAVGEGFHVGPLSFVVVPGKAGEPSWQRSGVERLVVEDPALDRVSALVHDIAKSGVNVLIQGETGVGKEVLASSLHALSGRSGPLVRINCAALSGSLLESELFGHEKGAFTGAVASRAGLLESASGGTVFLDEIGELPLGIQATLLRAVESREVVRLGSTRPISIDVRFVAATNRDLPAEVAAERFRQDLYFRLDGVSLHIPPLRARKGMIGPLALGFLAEARIRLGRERLDAEPELWAALEAHSWPGNVRELRAVIDRAVLLARGGTLGVRHLAFSPRSDAAATAAREVPAAALRPEAADLPPDQRADRDRVLAALEACVGNQTRAAKLLGISRTTLVQKLRLYRIPRPRT